MRLRFVANLSIMFAFATTARAAPPVELELATERGVQITAPHEWLQRLADIGVENVRIRGIRAGDEPRVDNRGTSERPMYHVLGIITARDQLVLPGGAFSRADGSRIKDYFDRLTADGADSLTAPRGLFGLTETELKAVFADLAQPIDFETKGQPARALLDRLQAKFALKLIVEADADRVLRAREPLADDLSGLSAGTGLAMVLRSAGLVVRPEKSRGQPVVYRITSADADSIMESTLGKTTDTDIKDWPIGWEPRGTPGETAPALFEFLNAEIDGYTLQETLAAIGPRVKIPFYLDHAALDANNIDPAKFQVRLARTRTFYKRVLDRVLSQARLGCQVRVDEAGNPFLWITR
jgi:hypothetical protein